MVLSVEYSSDFVRKFKKLSKPQQDEAYERIEEFRNAANHKRLRVHKLKGTFKERLSFSVNYSDRIVFRFSKDKRTAYLLDIGDHTIYE